MLEIEAIFTRLTKVQNGRDETKMSTRYKGTPSVDTCTLIIRRYQNDHKLFV